MIIPDKHISFKDFVGSLLTDFSTTDAIPYETNENNWKYWGNLVASSPTFVKSGAPRTESFTDWREWGKFIYGTIG